MLIKSGLLQESDSKMDKELGTQEERVESLGDIIRLFFLNIEREKNTRFRM